VAKDRREPGAAELLGDWRAAERDTVAAKAAQSIAEKALRAARAAQAAAAASEKAAMAALKAASRAQEAADLARAAAGELSEGSTTDADTTETAKARANHVLADAEVAETKARDRYHEAEARNFSRDET
jgi:hypothetical protein